MKPCPICGGTGPWPEGRYVHIRSHHETTCPDCGATVNEVGLASHRRVLHGGATGKPGPEPVEEPPVEPDPVPAAAAEPAGDPTPAPVLACEECGKEFADRQRLAAHRSSHRTVACPDCGETYVASGLGRHRARHRQTSPDRARPPRGIADALTALIPGAASDLTGRLAEFVDKHQPDRHLWVVATAQAGPWLCRAGQIGLLAAREHTAVVAVSVDDVYGLLDRRRMAS